MMRMETVSELARTYNQNHVPRKYTQGRRRVSVYISWSYPGEANRNPAELDNRFSTMTEVRRVVWPAYEAPSGRTRCSSSRASRARSSCSSGPGCSSSSSSGRSPGMWCPCSSGSTRRASSFRSTSACSPTRTRCFVFGLDHMVTEQEARSGGDRGGPAVPRARGNLPGHRPAPRRRGVRRHEGARHGVPPPRRRAGAAPATLRQVHARADEGARDPGRESLRPAPRA